jgi:nitrogen fixation/metabolism regulation signal transduction histidine kinase
MARQVAHDIKNPLTPIQLSAEHARRVNIDRGRPLSPVLDECVTVILNQVKLLRQISSEFSSFASSPVARPETTDLGTLISEVAEPYRMGLAGRIGIETDTAPDVPSLVIDRTLFARALTNVIENALHAMPGQGQLTITTRRATDPAPRALVGAAPTARAVGSGVTSPRAVATDRGRDAIKDVESVTVTIADTGVGMDREALARIFEPYFSTKATGTGLGLVIAKRNMELNGGRIDVQSERGVGTTVTMTLPIREA